MPDDPKQATEEQPTERRRATPSDGFVTIEQLMEEQGITEPQGLDSFERSPESFEHIPWPWTEFDD